MRWVAVKVNGAVKITSRKKVLISEEKRAMRSIAQAFVIQFDGPSGTRRKFCFSLRKSFATSKWNRKLHQLGYNLFTFFLSSDYHNNGNIAASIHAARQIHMGWDFLLLSSIIAVRTMFCFVFIFFVSRKEKLTKLAFHFASSDFITKLVVLCISARLHPIVLLLLWCLLQLGQYVLKCENKGERKQIATPTNVKLRKVIHTPIRATIYSLFSWSSWVYKFPRAINSSSGGESPANPFWYRDVGFLFPPRNGELSKETVNSLVRSSSCANDLPDLVCIKRIKSYYDCS